LILRHRCAAEHGRRAGPFGRSLRNEGPDTRLRRGRTLAAGTDRGDGVTSGAVLSFIGHELTRRGPLSPALVKHEAERANDVQSRIADAITGFAGSMSFVYVHIVWFASWIVLGIEKYPYGLLTMIVSLEAIFLSTFVMISQNRADARRAGVRRQPVRDDSGGEEAEPRVDRTGQAHPATHGGGAGADPGCSRHARQELAISLAEAVADRYARRFDCERGGDHEC